MNDSHQSDSWDLTIPEQESPVPVKSIACSVSGKSRSKKLTPKQEGWILEVFANGGDFLKAAKDKGYSKINPHKSVYDLLRSPLVQQRLKFMIGDNLSLARKFLIQKLWKVHDKCEGTDDWKLIAGQLKSIEQIGKFLGLDRDVSSVVSFEDLVSVTSLRNKKLLAEAKGTPGRADTPMPHMEKDPTSPTSDSSLEKGDPPEKNIIESEKNGSTEGEE